MLSNKELNTQIKEMSKGIKAYIMEHIINNTTVRYGYMFYDLKSEYSDDLKRSLALSYHKDVAGSPASINKDTGCINVKWRELSVDSLPFASISESGYNWCSVPKDITWVFLYVVNDKNSGFIEPCKDKELVLRHYIDGNLKRISECALRDYMSGKALRILCKG